MFINGAWFLFVSGGQPASQACGIMTAARFLGKPQDWQGDSCGLCFCGESVSGGGFFGRQPDANRRACPAGSDYAN